jgi:acyl-CoA thioesterase FadM
MKSIPLDGEIRDGRHVLTVRVYYEDTDLSGVLIVERLVAPSRNP